MVKQAELNNFGYAIRVDSLSDQQKSWHALVLEELDNHD
jgi:hypothetical protein